jgi:ribonuclease HI
MRQALANFLIKPTTFVPLKTKLSKPVTTALLQTDGSFNHQIQMSRTASILQSRQGELTLSKTYLDHASSTESEWCSILDGLKFAAKKDEGSVHVENDNLGIVDHIIGLKKPPRLFMDYYLQIFKEVRGLDYVGIRWIPREMNRADDLFRI